MLWLPGFPPGGDVNLWGGGQILPKTAWNWKNLHAPGGGGASKILPCRSAKVYTHVFVTLQYFVWSRLLLYNLIWNAIFKVQVFADDAVTSPFPWLEWSPSLGVAVSSNGVGCKNEKCSKWIETFKMLKSQKFREGNVFSHACHNHSVHGGGGQCHMTITPDALDLTVQPPPPPPRMQYCELLLFLP